MERVKRAQEAVRGKNEADPEPTRLKALDVNTNYRIQPKSATSAYAVTESLHITNRTHCQAKRDVRCSPLQIVPAVQESGCDEFTTLKHWVYLVLGLATRATF